MIILPHDTYYALNFSLSFVSGIFFLFLMWLFYTKFYGAEYYPASKKVVRKMIEFAKLEKKDAAYDLGCGDGRIVIEAAKKCRKAVGIEIDMIRMLWAKLKSRKIKNVRIMHGNMFLQDIKDADVIFIFLRQKANDKLLEKFKKELKPGSMIVSHYWKMSLKPYAVDEKLRVYAYKL